eukprot:CAMPEP_0172170558 /NCGR_PEP_ID=MMETSP1050-20130122/11343_1 /TAXON_ID=233186 /ORGANISM="Cryptomonas curvata, Strain CCAP979/52" /LENGTH=107 /DNA_ID=CAMNT_0012841771 /DNA_START=326 /DNA_END=646 /DNA_ORIENTATION=-
MIVTYCQTKTTTSIPSCFLLVLISCVGLTHANFAPNIHRHAIEGPHQQPQSSGPSSYDSDDTVLPAPQPSLGGLRFAHIAWGLDKAYVTATYIGAPHFRRNGWGFNP